MGLEDYLAAERAEGERVSEDASFTLDPAQLRARVGGFCEQERLYPLFRCLQGALRVTQSDLFLRYQEDAWTLSFQWSEAPTAQAFQKLLLDGDRAGFDKIQHSATQHFFFGLSAALGVATYRLTWSSTVDGFRIREGRFESSQESSEGYCQLSFAIDSGWWQRLTGGGPQKEATSAELRARLCYSPVPVHIDGERLRPRLPIPPDRPWAPAISQGSNLAWRFLVAHSGGRFQPPEVPLDRYRSGGKGNVWHLITDDPLSPLPLSVQIHPPPPPLAPATGPRSSSLFENGTSVLNGAPLSETALFLSLVAGRQDWLFPVADGLLGEPLPIEIGKGGLLVVSASDQLNYDLSGLKVISDRHLESLVTSWQVAGKALRSQLRLSLANTTLRSEKLPEQYYQATGYLMGGPYLGMLAGKLGPSVRRLLSRREDKR